MTDGVLLVAFDSVTDTNGQPIRYREFAKISAKFIRHYLQLPVAIITDSPIDGFDKVIIVDKPKPSGRIATFDKHHDSYDWYNNIRIRAGDLTPWSRTLMLDVDYLIQTDQFKSLFQTDMKFGMIGNVDYIPDNGSIRPYKTKLPNNTIRELWASALYWVGNGKEYFDYAKAIEQNYEYYAALFGISKIPIRNDLIFSIVAHVMPVDVFPWSSTFVSGIHELFTISDVATTFYNGSNCVLARFYRNDIHILNKQMLVDERPMILLDKHILHQINSTKVHSD